MLESRGDCHRRIVPPLAVSSLCLLRLSWGWLPSSCSIAVAVGVGHSGARDRRELEFAKLDRGERGGFFLGFGAREVAGGGVFSSVGA